MNGTADFGDFVLIKQGAEAKIYKGLFLGRPSIIKERFVKKYRHHDLDERLTKERLRAECRTLVRCKIAGIKTPAVYGLDTKKRCIYMEYLNNAETLKDYAEAASKSGTSIESVLQKTGAMLGKMHANNIIHGDLTTSNILLLKDSDTAIPTIVLIDFGLSSVDESAEDKAVDLYVLERAIISAHSEKSSIFQIIMKAYAKEYKKGSADVLKKFEEVRLRGRKRLMIG